MKNNLPKLPNWLMEALPTPLEPTRINYVDGVYRVDGQDFTNLDDAYDHALEMDDYNVNIVLDPSVPEYEISQDEYMAIGQRFGHLGKLQYDYGLFLDRAQEWLNDQDNFLKAYDFVSGHPCFWVRSTVEPDHPTWHWSQDGHAMNLWQCPQADAESPTGYVYAMEAGAHMAPDYTEHAHDLRLDVHGINMEDAFIQMAKLVHQLFDLEGNSR